jgi:translation initiation factor 3 subunit A
VGQSPAALTVLHEHVTSKRSRSNPIATFEPVMLLFVELSVDLKKGKSAKEGLYQYKNIAQNTNVGTIEVSLVTTGNTLVISVETNSGLI